LAVPAQATLRNAEDGDEYPEELARGSMPEFEQTLENK